MAKENLTKSTDLAVHDGAHGGKRMKSKPVSSICENDIPEINAILAKQDTVNLTPGPNGTVKIIHIRRKIVKTVQGNDCAKS